MDCYNRSYNYKKYRQEGGKFSLVGLAISLRSGDLTHSEKQYSQRYYGVSVSATLQDGCKCCRIKKIEYSHPEWWDTKVVPLTNEQEDRSFRKALRDCDITMEQFVQWVKDGVHGCLYGPNAKKYDTSGCGLSFIFPSIRLWNPDPDKVWCSEECKELWAEALPYYIYLIDACIVSRPDETTPLILDTEIGFYFQGGQDGLASNQDTSQQD